MKRPNELMREAVTIQVRLQQKTRGGWIHVDENHYSSGNGLCAGWL